MDAVAVRNKYGGRTQPRVYLPDRRWPSREMTKCPDFLAVDLRDGNQALPKAMTLEQKVVIFKELVLLGFKEIELAFAGSSRTDFNFVRHIVESDLAPDDVCIQVVSPCRKDAVLNAVQSLAGAKRANIFLYIGCSDNMRETVLGLNEEQWLERAISCTAYAGSLVRDGGPYANGTKWSLSFAFEDFSNARIEPVARCMDAVRKVWQPTIDDKMVFCVAASVEVSTPNVFADRVESLLRQVGGRETFRFAVHPHNDRGCAVAAAELACLAGADRVDGCLFGHGERAGNVDVVVVAGNAMASGLHTGLDLTRLDKVAKLYADITCIPVHPRTPYSGKFYFRAFSGLHQDSILKGLRARKAASAAPTSSKYNGNKVFQWPSWRILYLPVDPNDLGRDLHACVFGITSQSGKSGAAWVLKHGLGLHQIPEDLLRQFSATVKELAEGAEQLGQEISHYTICQSFCQNYRIDSLCRSTQYFCKIGASEKQLTCLADVLTAMDRVQSTTGYPLEQFLARMLCVPEDCQVSVGYEAVDWTATYTAQLLKGDTVAYAEFSGSGINTAWGVGTGFGKAEALVQAFVSARMV